jgi:hypothetical protein
MRNSAANGPHDKEDAMPPKTKGQSAGANPQPQAQRLLRKGGNPSSAPAIITPRKNADSTSSTAPAAQQTFTYAKYTWERKCTGKNEEQECNPLFRFLNDGEKNKREKDGYDASIFQTIRKKLLRMRNW